jgi:hypothetical protein
MERCRLNSQFLFLGSETGSCTDHATASALPAELWRDDNWILQYNYFNSPTESPNKCQKILATFFFKYLPKN